MMKQITLGYVLRGLLFIFAVLLFTALTQIGGFILILSASTFPYLKNRSGIVKRIFLWGTVYFIGLYLLATFLVVPFLAPLSGRVALPAHTQDGLRPHTWMTVLLNRRYVRPELRAAMLDVSAAMRQKHPETDVLYLDANFPFFNKFPLLPHLSHNDGRKLDLAFCYQNKNGSVVNDSPSWLGYGVCEEARKGEFDAANECAKKGYWQYSILKKITGGSSVYDFDSTRTKTLLRLLLRDKRIGKIFLEPHLKTRLGLKSSKIDFHGCHAVRHDDHIHIQL